MDQEIENTVKSCWNCQKNRPNQPVVPLIPWQWPTRPWSRVHVDFAGPVKNNMYLIVIDSHSKWIDVQVMSSIAAPATIQRLRHIFSQFGLPEQIISDNGPTFTSTEFKDFLQKNGVKHVTSAPYHPASNGLAERAVQILKKGLKKCKEGTIQTQIDQLLFNYRITPQTTTGVSPAELMFGRRLRSVFDLMKPDLHNRVEKEQERQKLAHDKKAVNRDFNVGDEVYAKNFRPGDAETWLPARVIEKQDPRNFTVELLQDNLVWRRHVDHLHPRHVADSHRAAAERSPVEYSSATTNYPNGLTLGNSPPATADPNRPLINEISTTWDVIIGVCGHYLTTSC